MDSIKLASRNCVGMVQKLGRSSRDRVVCQLKVMEESCNFMYG